MLGLGANCALLPVLGLLLGFLLFPQEASAYSQVLVSGSAAGGDQGPRIFKAMNTDLIFPKM